MNFFRESDLEVKQVLEGITLKSVAGEHTMMTFFTFGPGSVIPSHKHPHEQVANITEGKFELTVDGETQIVEAGDVVVIPSNTKHSGKAITNCKIIDIFKVLNGIACLAAHPLMTNH